MKARNKYVLEGAIVELVHDEYDRLLSIDDMMTNIDSQQYLGGVTKEEATQCLDVLKRVKELKDNEITLLQTLSRNMFAYVRPEVTATDAKEDTTAEGETEAIEGQVTMDEVTGTAAELDKEKAMKGMEEYNVNNVATEEKQEEAKEE